MNIHSFAQLTFCYFNTSIESMEEAVSELFINKTNNNKYSYKKKKFEVLDVFDDHNSDKPQFRGGKYLYKALVFAPATNKKSSVMISNLNDGWFTLCNVISKYLKIDYYLFTIDSDPNPEAKNSFIYCSNGEIKRVVYTLKEDNKWVFHNQGSLLSFEFESNYKKKQIKDRLNSIILVQYCNKLGLKIENDNFWESEQDRLLIEYKW